MRHIVIDGYNLLYSLGFLPKQLAAGELQQGRARLLHFLATHLQGHAERVTVVFDAADAPPFAKCEQWYRGMRILFARGDPQADDLIERLIEQEAHKLHLTVVSDDHRLQHAARRWKAHSQGCAVFLDWLEKNPPQQTPGLPPEKTERLSAEELKHWLSEFGDLENNPEFKDLFDRFD